jgi:predicted Fe-S protein YdhL (DUF1289 family)
MGGLASISIMCALSTVGGFEHQAARHSSPFLSSRNGMNRDISLRSEQEQENQNQGASSWVSITPCVRICRYNADFYGGQVCIGCFREGFEISAWSSMSDGERSMAVLDAADRCPDASKAGEWVFEGSISKEELLKQSRFWSQRGGSQQ